MNQTRTLGLQLVLGQVLTILLMCVAIGTASRIVAVQLLEEQLALRARFIAADVAEHAVSPLLTDDRYALERLPLDHAHDHEDIEYIFLLNSTDRVVAHTFEGGFPVGLSEAHRGTSAEPSLRFLETSSGSVLDVAMPVLRGDAGTVRLGLSRRRLDASATRLSRILWAVILGVGALGLIGSASGARRLARRADQRTAELRREVAERTRAEQALQGNRDALATLNNDLSALHALSVSLNRTLRLEELVKIALETVTTLEAASFERKGGIFLVEGSRMRLAGHLGFSQSFIDCHEGMMLGDCLCGIAAVRGQIVTSTNSAKDPRHTITYPGMHDHGHIVIPLTAPSGVIGALNLYTRDGLDPRSISPDLLMTMGNQIGAALENARSYEDARSSSLVDPLTGLANRRRMEMELSTAVEKAQRYGNPLSVLMIDVDHFKRFNDAHGHAEGDKLLSMLGAILRDALRTVDVAVRYGGEEFLVVMPETPHEPALEVAERLRAAVAARTSITISLGVATWVNGLTKADLIALADTALYEAKDAGRNRVRAAESPGASTPHQVRLPIL